MAETIDVQARNDVYDETIRAKNEETKLAYALEQIRAELQELKASVEDIDLSRDDAPTYESENLLSSGAIYQALQTLNRKIDSLK